MSTAITATKVVSTFDPEDMRKYKHKWNNTEEYEIVKKIRERFEEMRTARASSCYWSSPSTTAGGVMGSGADWSGHWNLCFKLWSMWKKYIKGRSNLKSPTSFAAVEAAVSEFIQNIPTVSIYTDDDDDDSNVKAINAAIQAFENTQDMEQKKIESIQSCAIVGTQFFYNGYIYKAHDVEYIIEGDEIEKTVKSASEKKEKGDDSEYKSIDDKIHKDKKPLTKKGLKVDYDDVAIVPVSIYEIFVDPAARCIRGLVNEAVDIIWRQTPSLEQFRAEFVNSNDPFVIKKNIDKVSSATNTMNSYTGEQRFFHCPDDIAIDSDRVELVRYWNKATDQEIVLCNDILIKKGPLSYNHKELPFSLSKFINFPDQLYGVGIPAVLESLQSEDETLRNMALEVVKRQLMNIILVSRSASDDFISQYDPMDTNVVIELSTSTGPESVRVLEMPNAGLVGFQQLRATIREDVIIASQINTMAMAAPKPGEPVRNNMMSMESTLKGLKKGFTFWGFGYKESIRQVVSVMKQKYTVSYATYMGNDVGAMTADKAHKEAEKKYRKIKIKGYSLIEDKEGKLVEQKLDNPNAESSLQFKPEYLSLNGNVKVKFGVEAFAPMSKGLQMQKIEQAMRDLIPILGNPQLLNAPGVVELVRQYCETHGITERVIEMLQTQSSEEQVRLAEEQNDLICQGITVAGKPGESEAHKMVHFAKLIALTFEINEKEKQFEIAMAKIPVEMQLDPMTGQMISIPPKIKPDEKLEKMKMYRDMINDHMLQDNESKQNTYNVAASMYGMASQQMAQGGPMMPPEAMGGQPGMDGGMGLPPEAQELIAQGVPPQIAMQMLMQQAGGGQLPMGSPPQPGMMPQGAPMQQQQPIF